MTARRRKPASTARAARRVAAPASTRPGAGAPAAVAGPAADGAAPFPAGRLDAVALAALALGPLALYVCTLPRTVASEDDSLFLLAGVHLGVGHPPGHPLYTLIVHLFTRLPFGDPAFLGHLSSAMLGALACGGVYACARLLHASPVPALTAAWLFGVSEQFWSQAIIAEVYTLNALLFFATYALVLYGARDPRRGWPLVAAAAAWGGGLANHWPLLVLATPGLLVALLPVRWDVLARLLRLLGVALLTAAIPYAWMVWLSQQAPLISFYGSIDMATAPRLPAPPGPALRACRRPGAALVRPPTMTARRRKPATAARTARRAPAAARSVPAGLCGLSAPGGRRGGGAVPSWARAVRGPERPCPCSSTDEEPRRRESCALKCQVRDGSNAVPHPPRSHSAATTTTTMATPVMTSRRTMRDSGSVSPFASSRAMSETLPPRA